MKYFVGIDIGSTATKVAILRENKNEIFMLKSMPSGYNSKDTSLDILKWLNDLDIDENNSKIIATGYGRISVPYANKSITEITAHAKGAVFLGASDEIIIDIGGQDTKVIILENKRMVDFIMNDKCSAGTGKFIEVMANRLGLSIDEFFKVAKLGTPINITSTCTVFAESEIISLINKNISRNDLAAGVIVSMANKVLSLASKKQSSDKYFLTGGFSQSDFVIKILEEKLNAKVSTHEFSRFAGAIGAALS
ncbi:acyl-CoA dehydratase activase [Campylobacter sp. MG1]|uniref:acyl-CoA dehydratase activase n=1 Tax=Campylobacter sp. MG1 TaxID=2976332 RepID=UPI00226D17D0|nr:acyl-CoA dehydratase activase [Campylobacter sp. MG1]